MAHTACERLTCQQCRHANSTSLSAFLDKDVTWACTLVPHACMRVPATKVVPDLPGPTMRCTVCCCSLMHQVERRYMWGPVFLSEEQLQHCRLQALHMRLHFSVAAAVLVAACLLLHTLRAGAL